MRDPARPLALLAGLFLLAGSAPTPSSAQITDVARPPGGAGETIAAAAPADSSAPGPFRIDGAVRPPESPLGSAVAFRTTVTNIGNREATFGVDGCPVQYTIDGIFSPMLACAEFYRPITLRPGESVTFTAENHPYLVHEGNDFPIGPGPHRVRLEIRGAGVAEVPFTVGRPDPALTYASGRITTAGGEGVAAAEVTLVRRREPNALDLPPDEERYQAVTGDAGYFFFAGIRPGTYRMVVQDAGLSIWYPGTSDPEQADELPLGQGAYRSALDLVVPAGPPWPPGRGLIQGRVVETSASDAAVPLDGAWVAAVPVWRAGGDTIPPRGSDPGRDSDVPLENIWTTVTRPDGSYSLSVPFGEYRLIAGREDSHRYRYWSYAARWGDAEIVGVWGPDAPASDPLPGHHFALPRETAPAPARLTGRVLGQNPNTDGLPQPIAGATVSAWPLEGDWHLAIAETRTDANGDYDLQVDWDSPYRVTVRAEGYEQGWYDGKPHLEAADGVDVKAGGVTAGIDFVLAEFTPPPPPPEGTIQGIVRGRGSASGILEPLGGAWVVAVAANRSWEDSVWIGADGSVRPTRRVGPPEIYYGSTAADGTFRLGVPPGAYRVLAGQAGYRHQYWRSAARWADAVLTNVFAWPSRDAEAPEIYHEFDLTPSADAGWAEIEGTVLDDNPMLGRPPMPIPGARVIALPIGPFFLDILLMAETDENGRWSIRVPGGMPCFVIAEAEGFQSEYFDNAPNSSLATGVDVTPETVTGPINFGLAPLWTPPPVAALRGTVFAAPRDGAERPLANAWVSAVPVTSVTVDTIPPDGGGGDEPTRTLQNSGGFPYLVFTGEDGTFALEVPAGLYRVLAGDHGAHAYQYWDHAARWNEATPVDAWDFVLPPPGTARPELTFHLSPAASEEWATLRGQVLAFDPMTDGPPEPLAGAVLTATPVGASYERMIFCAVSDENGFYEIGVPARSPWRVEANAEGYERQYYRDKRTLEEADGIDVHPGGTTSGVDFVLRPWFGPGAGIIEGWVWEKVPGLRCETGERCIAPAAGVRVRVEAAYPTFAPYIREAITDRDGYYRVADLAAADDGSLSYYVSAAREGMEPLYYPNGVSFPFAEPLPVFPGEVSSAGTLTIPGGGGGGGAGFLVGQIVDAGDQGIAGATVRVYLEPGNPRGPVVSGETREDGSFSFGSLPEGTPVLVAAEAEGFVPAYYPAAHRWRDAQLVTTGGPAIDPAPLIMGLRPAIAGGPFIQAARVRAGDSGGGEDSTVVSPLELPRFRALQYHARNVARAHVYLVNALSMAPIDLPVAGGITGDNGTVILTGLPEGVYYAFADRPGYTTAYFAVSPQSTPIPIFLNATTPAVLAEIRLVPIDAGGGRDEAQPGVVTNVTNAPNPFRPRTVIRFDLNGDEPVTVEIFDFQGRLVRCLEDATWMTAGERAVAWDGTDAAGRPVGSGVYFYRVKAGVQSISRKMVLLPR